MSETYSLTPDDLIVARQFMSLQNKLGAGTPPFADATVMQLMAQLDTLSDSYPQSKNTKLRSLIDSLYTLLANVDTCYKQKFPALYLAYHYANFGFQPDTDTVIFGFDGDMGVPARFRAIDVPKGGSGTASHSYNPYGQEKFDNASYNYRWVSIVGFNDNKGYATTDLGMLFLQGGTNYYHVKGYFDNSWTWWESNAPSRFRGAFPIPQSPDAWQRAISSFVTTWISNPSLYSSFLLPSSSFSAVGDVQSQTKAQLLSVSHWSDVEKVKEGVAAAWATQSADVKTLIRQQSPLDADAYVYLFYLLTALAVSNAEDRKLVVKIVNATASSDEHANDIFINQLVYLMLMHWAHPAPAGLGLTNAQLQSEVSSLSGTVIGKDRASQAIKTSLDQHFQVLSTDNAYPMQSPDSGDPFDVRQADTLAALESARATLKTGLDP